VVWIVKIDTTDLSIDDLIILLADKKVYSVGGRLYYIEDNILHQIELEGYSKEDLEKLWNEIDTLELKERPFWIGK